MYLKRQISILAGALAATALSAAIAGAQVERTPTQPPSIEIPTVPGQPVPVPVPLGPCQIAIQLNPGANVIVGSAGPQRPHGRSGRGHHHRPRRE